MFDFKNQFEEFLLDHLKKRQRYFPEKAKALMESVRYSLFSGGKRFRPQLSVLTAEMLECSIKRVLPYAAALELIHTYSLIHDDLPCMDDDIERRGQPTNHMVYGESTALLAGDALLTEAFFILGHYYEGQPDIGLKLTLNLAEAAGLTGMVAGQVLDIDFGKNESRSSLAAVSREALIRMHELKTGALIRAAVVGVAEVARAGDLQKQALQNFGSCIGLAFQLADDVLDYNPDQLEPSGFPKWVGIEHTRLLLEKFSTQARTELLLFGERATPLIELIDYNLTRKS